MTFVVYQVMYNMWKALEHFLRVIILILLFDAIICDIRVDMWKTVEEIREKSRKLYGDADKRRLKKWELDVEDTLSYPNGDKQKLAILSHLWVDYYLCSAHALESVTSSKHLPSSNIVVYEGVSATIPCGLCVAPGESGSVVWLYSKSIHNLPFTALKAKSTLIMNINLTIYNVGAGDAGVYRCALGSSLSGLRVLEVLNDNEYDVMTQQSALNHRSVIRTMMSPDLIAFHIWSPWSDCSGCDHGHRRRYGICYVRIHSNKITNITKNNYFVTQTTIELFREFPQGIACRSQLLPPIFGHDRTINTTVNVIINEPCNIPCQEIFEIRTSTGEVLEQANNSGGMYSLHQVPPRQPPPPGREVVFAEYGDTLTLTCPGTTLRDIPISWRVGREPLRATGGRMSLNARDQIVFSSVEYRDANVYSCWQSVNLAGVVKVQVWEDARFANGRPIAIVSLIVIAMALRFAIRVLHPKLRHSP